MTDLMLFQLVGVFLFGVGIFGLVWRKTLVGMLIAMELMINGAGLSIVAAAQLTAGDAVKGQLAALFVMGLAAAEATLILAIVLVVVKRFKSSKTDGIFNMRW
jgi:NADH-quinone oxidoreductase subunit K